MPLDAASSWTEPAAPVHGWGHESRGTPAQPDGTGLPRGHRTGRPADDPAGPYPGRPRRAALQHRVSRVQILETSIAGLPLRQLRDGVEIVPQLPIISRPDPNRHRSEFVRLTVGDMVVRGEAFWLKLRAWTAP